MSQWPYHSENEIAAVAEVLRSGKTNYWVGEHGQAFESEFAAYTGAQHALTVSNGTTALEVAIHALGISYGEVILPCRTFMATASAVVMNGLTPVLADIDETTLNVTVDTLEARRTPQTKAVIVVHYAGLPCDIEAICQWAAAHQITVIEDCAHAHGARVGGKHVGTFGAIGCFSFCVGKIMSTGGEGGMVVTRDPALHARMAAYRDHGRYQIAGNPMNHTPEFLWTVSEFGSNLRMTEMQSAIGRIQLKKLYGWVARRNEIADIYDAILYLAPGVTLIRPPPLTCHARYMYLLLVEKRDEVLRRVFALGARLGGCPNIGHEKAFRGHAAPCPVADAIGGYVMSLPIYPTLTDAEVDAIAFATLRATVEVNK